MGGTRANARRPADYMPWRGFVMAGAVLLLGAAGTRFPEELLPTRSDFDFWARRGERDGSLRFAGEPGQTRWICCSAAGAQ